MRRFPSTSDPELDDRGKTVVTEREENYMALWIIGYGMFLVSFFALCAAILGLNTTMWGFALVFTGCTVASLVLWWREERQWQAPLQRQEASPFTITLPSHTSVVATSPPAQSTQPNQDWLPLEGDDFDLLETYTQDLTERVEAVYPLVGRDHVHKIVWTVMIELFCKRMATSSHSTPASLITARMARAA